MIATAKASVAAVIAVLVLLVAYALGSVGHAGATPAAAAPTADATSAGIEVTGVGEVAGTPDVLRLDMSAEVHASSVEVALQKTNAAMTKVIKALKDGGVAG